MKMPVIAESTLEFDISTKMPQAIESPSNPFFFLDDEENTKSNSGTLEQIEEPILQSESSEPSTVVNEISTNLETDPPMTTEVFEAQPKVPQEDPFANGSNVKSLISPLKTQTLYDILQCDISSTRSEIKRSYLALAKETHPDALLQNGVTNDQDTDKRFNEIARAYKILSDPTERRRYNRELKAKGLSRSAGNVFENWVMGAAKAMDVALTKAEMDLESRRSKENS
jgi:DnaJ-domain-containing protein 1